MTTKLVWFGNFESGYFDKNNDKYPCVIVHSIAEKVNFNYEHIDEIEEYMTENHYDSYLIPSEWKWEVFYSQTFMKELSL